MKILLAADGSPFTQAAARFLREHIADYSPPRQVHVLHVQAPLPYAGHANIALGKATVDRLRREEVEAALAVAERELGGVDAQVVYAQVEGPVSERIAQYATEHGIDLVVIGSRGFGPVASLALGSVARDCIEKFKGPVLVIPRASAARAAPAAGTEANTAR